MKSLNYFVFLSLFISAGTLYSSKISISESWGRIANKKYLGQKIYTTIYFPGAFRDNQVETATPLDDERGFDEKNIRKQINVYVC